MSITLENEKRLGKYPIVAILWNDAAGCCSDWTEIKETGTKVAVNQSCGWLVEENKECFVVVPHLSLSNKSTPLGETPDQGCGDMTIPKRCVIAWVLLEDKLTNFKFPLQENE